MDTSYHEHIREGEYLLVNELPNREAGVGAELRGDEAALITGLNASDQGAFEAIYNDYYERVYYFAKRYVESQEAQDITAETFLALWDRRAHFDHMAKVTQFLFVTTRNRCYNVIKREGHKHRYAAEMAALMKSDNGDNFYVEQQVRVELTRLLHSQINLLPPKTRQVFLLSFEEGLMPAEIAQRLGLSVKTVKNQKLTAIKVLREALAGHPLEIIFIFLLSIPKNFPVA